MDVESTIQFLIQNAAQHDQRIAAMETNAVAIEASLLTLAKYWDHWQR